jgi:hypothetical protein
MERAAKAALFLLPAASGLRQLVTAARTASGISARYGGVVINWNLNSLTFSV